MNPYIKPIRVSQNLPTIICFSAVNTARGMFKPYRALLNIQANVLFVNDDENRWYRRGLPQISNNSIEAAIKAVRYARKMGNGRVVTFGSSMGGAGAVLFGALGKADGCLAYGAEFNLGSRGTRSASLMKVEKGSPWRDLRKAVENTDVPIHLFASEDDDIDLSETDYVLSALRYPASTVLGMGHPGIQAFQMDGTLTSLLERFATSGEIPTAFERKGTILDRKAELDVVLSAYARWLERDHTKACEILEVGCDQFPDSAALHWRLGEAYARLGRQGEAEAAWERSGNLCRWQSIAPMRLGHALRLKGQYEEALFWLNRAATTNTFMHEIPSERARCLAAMGNIVQALPEMERAVKMRPQSEEYKALLEDFRSRATNRVDVCV